MKMLSRRPALAVLAMSAALAFTAPAFAETIAYTAKLSGPGEVPPNTTAGTGTGMVDATYDTASKKLSWTVTYSGLTAPAIMAHFHGPAAAGANAPPVVPMKDSLASPMKGEAVLTDAQAADLAAGMWYFNIHTPANKGGEIRGQMMKK